MCVHYIKIFKNIYEALFYFPTLTNLKVENSLKVKLLLYLRIKLVSAELFFIV